MADHINISEPDQYGQVYGLRKRVAMLEAELAFVSQWKDALIADLDALFTRIGRGEECILYYRNGETITIIPKPKPAQS
jgi:hypothetical protein